MKIIKWLVITLIALVAVALVTLIVWGGGVIKHSVNTIGPQVLGVPVKLDSARFHPFRGYVHLSGLFVGNPEGFNTESLFEMHTLEIDLNMRSLLTDTIIIERILIEAPQITYEVGLRRTNLGALLEQLEGEMKEEAPKEEKPKEPEPDAPAKQVVIRELVLADARAQVSATAMGGRVVPIQLSTITLNDLGGEDQSLNQIITEVLKAILGAVGNAVAGAGDLLGDGLNAALQGAGTLGGMASDGVRAGADIAADGVRAVTGAIGEGARSARELIRRGDRQPVEGEPGQPNETEAVDEANE